MMKNKRKIISANYLEKIPIRPEHITWTTDNGMVVLHVENKGVVKRLTQIFLGKPKISYIHLDEEGSFVWLLMDGDKNILEIGNRFKEHFGEKAEPLYERMAQYFRILESYGFIAWKKQKTV